MLSIKACWLTAIFKCWRVIVYLMLGVEQTQKIYVDLYETADLMMLNGVMPPDRIMGALDYLALVLGDDCPLGYEWRDQEREV